LDRVGQPIAMLRRRILTFLLLLNGQVTLRSSDQIAHLIFVIIAMDYSQPVNILGLHSRHLEGLPEWGPCERLEITSHPVIHHGVAKIIDDLGNDPFVFTVLHIASSTDAIQHMLKFLFDPIKGTRG
jgi:hypothetical protein